MQKIALVGRQPLYGILYVLLLLTYIMWSQPSLLALLTKQLVQTTTPIRTRKGPKIVPWKTRLPVVDKVDQTTKKQWTRTSTHRPHAKTMVGKSYRKSHVFPVPLLPPATSITSCSPLKTSSPLDRPLARKKMWKNPSFPLLFDRTTPTNSQKTLYGDLHTLNIGCWDV